MSAFKGFSRRQFLGSLAGMGVLGAGAWGLWHGRNGETDLTEGSYFDSAIQPLFFAKRSDGIGSHISVQGLFDVRTRHHTVAFDLKGKEVFRNLTELNKAAVERVNVPDGLGWVSLFSVMEVEGKLGLSPNIEAGQFLGTTVARGQDAHHGYLWRYSGDASQTLMAPERGDATLVGLCNPLGTKQEVMVIANTTGGKRLFEKSFSLSPCETRHFVLGQWGGGHHLPAPESAIELNVPPGTPLVMSTRSSSGVVVPLSSWWLGGATGFTMSHGGFVLKNAPARLEYGVEAFIDLAFLGADRAWGIGRSTQLIIPNLNDGILSVRIRIDQIGTNQSKYMVLEIPPHSAHSAVLSEKLGLQAKDGPVTLHLEASGGNLPQALIKAINWDEKGRRSIQHGRPSDELFADALQKYLARPSSDQKVEQWISSGPWPAEGEQRIFVYNLNRQKKVAAILQGVHSDGSRSSVVLGDLMPAGWREFKLPVEMRSCRAICLVAEGGLLRMSLHHFDGEGLISSVHSTPRIKWEGVINKPPPLIARNS